jgi:Predicted O-methyltransferase
VKFEDVVDRIGHVGGRAATSPDAGRLLYEFVLRSRARTILELGFAHGNSTCYMAAALDEARQGSITTIDRESSLSREPNIHELLERAGLGAYVNPVFAHTSYNWELMQLIEQQRGARHTDPLFDFVFIDGAHTWEVDGLAFFLIDKLLLPGGFVLFDDVHWTLAASPALQNSERIQSLSEEEKRTPQIMRVFGLLVMQHPDYSNFTVKGNWAWAYKAADGQSGALDPMAVAALYASAADEGWPLA